VFITQEDDSVWGGDTIRWSASIDLNADPVWYLVLDEEGDTAYCGTKNWFRCIGMFYNYTWNRAANDYLTKDTVALRLIAYDKQGGVSDTTYKTLYSSFEVLKNDPYGYLIFRADSLTPKRMLYTSLGPKIKLTFIKEYMQNALDSINTHGSVAGVRDWKLPTCWYFEIITALANDTTYDFMLEDIGLNGKTVECAWERDLLGWDRVWGEFGYDNGKTLFSCYEELNCEGSLCQCPGYPCFRATVDIYLMRDF